MGKLIDADVLKQHIDKLPALPDGNFAGNHSALKALINMQPTVLPEIIYCHECKHFQCNMRFDGSVPKGADAYECRHWCGGCDPMDYCSCGERAERRADANNNLHV